MEEWQQIAKEEGLHQAIVIKVAAHAPDLKELRTILPKHLGVKGHYLAGLLAPRQFLIRFDRYEDFLLSLTR